jgi:poly-D-alanine transfer protein DltD
MKKLQKNEQRILRIADELEKQQLDKTYKNAIICDNLQLSKDMFYRLKPKALLEVQKRTEFKQSLTNEVITQEVTEAAKNGIKTRLEIIERLEQIAFAQIDVEETTSTPDGLIEHRRKPTPGEQTKALIELIKINGYNPNDKIENIISSYNITLNLNK